MSAGPPRDERPGGPDSRSHRDPFDSPPPEPPPGARLPPPDEHFRNRHGPLTTPSGRPRTGEPARRARRERAIVMVFLWICAVIAIAVALVALF